MLLIGWLLVLLYGLLKELLFFVFNTNPLHLSVTHFHFDPAKWPQREVKHPHPFQTTSSKILIMISWCPHSFHIEHDKRASVLASTLLHCRLYGMHFSNSVLSVLFCISSKGHLPSSSRNSERVMGNRYVEWPLSGRPRTLRYGNVG